MEHDFRSDHPTKDIISSLSNQLFGKKVCLGITSSVAILNSASLARELMRHGAEVYPVMTEKATELIRPKLIEWATGNPVITEITGQIEHVFMAGEREKKFGFADMIVIYPATAHTIGKIAHGLADNAVTAISMVSLGSKVPFVIIPAMHDSMFRNPIYQENVEKLKKLGVAFLGPRLEENKAKIANVEDVVQYILNFYQNKKKDFQNKKILITYGATREWIDDVRFLSNPATGKSGQVIAQELVARGAEVTIMKGPNSVPAPMGTKVINFISTEDCAKSIKEELNNNHYDVLISTAAFADFKIIVRMDGKIKSNSPNLTLHLENTPKVIKTARETQPDLFIVAYKAESSLTEEELISKAAKYMEKGNYNLIVANSVHPSLPDQGFAGDKNDVFIIDPEKNVLKSGYKYKTEIATLLLDTLRKKLT